MDEEPIFESVAGFGEYHEMQEQHEPLVDEVEQFSEEELSPAQRHTTKDTQFASYHTKHDRTGAVLHDIPRKDPIISGVASSSVFVNEEDTEVFKYIFVYLQ